ncbi:peroxisomal multifunctional enzyme type 2 isoform X1 [Neodiprion lecontei]|uniref:Peroxisomal multifunctional enzyme type 2 n=2 Tax=Neodiprion lecontei TaxID=441921 RepID=A0A6J0CG24_NEOLC|nr:peroxisomal multifunctional enzyme type 2 isoform X1 [Neodiprion lecontei]
MPEELRFDGRVVIVTGAGAGLGRAYALLFGSRGASIVVNDLGGGRHGDGSSSSVADSVVKEIRQNGGKAVANYDSVVEGHKIVDTAIKTFGRIDIVVNNAGILRDKSFAKISDQDWDLIHNVHVKGAFKTTQAAWPYFKKQKYGRVIVTSSNSGLYGNFGQANYSAAKMGLVGFANTLAIEGNSSNIYTNVIVPTAASRLTEDILPPDFFKELKPELIAPVVAWLCHENCSENGSIIEAAVGWAGKCHLIRSAGCNLRKKMSDAVTPEDARDNWAAVTDMTKAKRCESIQEASMEVFEVLKELQENSSQQKSDAVLKHTYDFRNTILYAIGVGATTEYSSDMLYLYENHSKFAVLPTYFVLFGPNALISSSILDDVPYGIQVDPSRTLHGEQYLEILKPIPSEASVETRFKIIDVLDKGSGAVIIMQGDTIDAATGEKLATAQLSAFAIGAGGFGGKRSCPGIIPTEPAPSRKPDISKIQKTCIDQAAVYRLSGDFNPLHIDSSVSSLGGYEKPILHGLCSLGFSTRHVLDTYAHESPDFFKAIKVRFSNPVIPGQTLRTDMWRNGNRIHFETTVLENNKKVITGAYIDLKAVKMQPIQPALCSAEENLESDAVFAAIADHVKAHPDQVKKINGIFVYNITSSGQNKAQWTLDLKKAEVYKGEPKSGKSDTSLTIEDKDMVEIALGKLNPQVAFMRGKLKIKGNIMLTQKLKTLLDANRAKL